MFTNEHNDNFETASSLIGRGKILTQLVQNKTKNNHFLHYV